VTSGVDETAALPAAVERFVAAFPWLRLDVRVRVGAPLVVDQYAGGMLRGALGWELQDLLCRRPAGRTCGADACAEPESCPFAQLWCPPPDRRLAYGTGNAAPAPLIVQGPPVGRLTLPSHGELAFSVVLVGGGRKELPTLLHALRRAGKRGLGARRVPFHVEEATLARPDAPDDAAAGPTAPGDPLPAPGPALPAVPAAGVRLRFVTPVCLRSRGSELRQAPLPAAAITRALCRRLGTLADYHARDLAQPDWRTLAALVDDDRRLDGRVEWYGWQRHSNVQGRDMTLTGLVGHLDWPAVPPALAPLVALGSLLHIGKNASLGLGRYTLLPLP
jgi:hypothetical protein